MLGGLARSLTPSPSKGLEPGVESPGEGNPPIPLPVPAEKALPTLAQLPGLAKSRSPQHVGLGAKSLATSNPIPNRRPVFLGKRSTHPVSPDGKVLRKTEKGVRTEALQTVEATGGQNTPRPSNWGQVVPGTGMVSDSGAPVFSTPEAAANMATRILRGAVGDSALAENEHNSIIYSVQVALNNGTKATRYGFTSFVYGGSYSAPIPDNLIPSHGSYYGTIHNHPSPNRVPGVKPDQPSLADLRTTVQGRGGTGLGTGNWGFLFSAQFGKRIEYRIKPGKDISRVIGQSRQGIDYESKPF